MVEGNSDSGGHTGLETTHGLAALGWWQSQVEGKSLVEGETRVKGETRVEDKKLG